MNKYTKTQRRQVLRQTVEKLGTGDQKNLLEELRKQGIKTTQATVSRDLQEMGYIKIRIKPGVYKYEAMETSSKEYLWKRLRVLFENFVTEITSTNNLILIKTSPGNANGVASFIDSIHHKDILGTIAGDDTILVVVDTAKKRRDVEKTFQDILYDVSKE